MIAVTVRDLFDKPEFANAAGWAFGFAVVGLFVWCAIIAAVVATARSIRAGTDAWPDARDEASRTHARALLVSLAVVATTFLTLPHSIGWFGFVDGRLVPLVLLLGLTWSRGLLQRLAFR